MQKIERGMCIMAYQIDKTECVGCGVCAGNCPVSAIDQKDDKYEINPDVCVSCGACESTCPVSAISQK
jgi:formate hydrogenlyase subunit 6/NADH:ubiquinone oxidoreductase subunit I